MPYELFWRGPLEAFDFYMEKANIEELREDARMWRQGIYVREAVKEIYPLLNPLAGKSPKRLSYPDKPLLVRQAGEASQTQENKNMLLYDRLKNWSAGVKARGNNTPSE